MPVKENMLKTELGAFLNFEKSLPPVFIIYSPVITPRLTYVCDFIFKQGLLSGYSISDNKTDFTKSDLIKINYSEEEMTNVFNVNASGFISQSSLNEFEPDTLIKNNLIYFFPVNNGHLPFDIFSAVFYFISRYEEWLPFSKDKHGRFELHNSILFKYKFHTTPVVDYWLNQFKHALKLFAKTLTLPNRKFKMLSTIDVDNVFAYKAKPFYRFTGALFKDVIKADFSNAKARVNTVLFNKPDPFDCYEYQTKLAYDYKIPLVYFFLYKNNSKFDRSIAPNHPDFLELIKTLGNKPYTAIGIHPSYYSSENPELLQEELNFFQKSNKQPVVFSRQHYLRWNIKRTPALLIQNNIAYDFTMGFASGPGFRAGTTLPFRFFDLKNNEETKLILLPFAFMDGAFYIYNSITSVKKAEIEITELIKKIKNVNGLFISVFHERSFSERIAKGWSEIYVNMLKAAIHE